LFSGVVALGAVVLNGVFVGLIYGLLAVGLVVTYRVSRIVNFAYGETGMLCAFVFFGIRLHATPARLVDHGIVVALPVAMLLGAAIGAVMERVIARPLRSNPVLNGMVGTIATSLLFITIGVDLWGPDVRATKPMLSGTGISVFGLAVSPQQILIGICTLVILVGLGALYRFSSFGLRLRATAIDPYAASLAGINTDATAMGTWALAGALSAISAILIAPLVAMNVVFMTFLALRSFAAALLGGLTSLAGAFAAGLILGVAEGIVTFKSPIAGMTDALVAVGVLLLLLVRPGGLVRASY
jgi:branched-chain amino acid transport system permease protein